MAQWTEHYLHRMQDPPNAVPPAGRKGRISIRTFLAPLILMVLHHLVLNLLSIARVFFYFLANPSLRADLEHSADKDAYLLGILIKSNAMTYASLYGMIVLIPVYLLYIHWRRRKYDPLVMTARVTWIQSFCSVAVILGVMGLTQLWMAVLASLDPGSAIGHLFQRYMDKMILFDAGSPLSGLDFLATVLLVPVGEELLFRGIIQGELRKGFPVSVSLTATALLFALFHLDLIQGSYVLIAGFALSMVYHLTENLLIPIAMHMVFNLVGSGWLTRLTGAGEKAEEIMVYTLYAFVVIGLGGMFTLLRARRKQGTTEV